MISVVVPTYREVDNVEPLVRALDHALSSRGVAYELIIVDDDSRDGIDDRVRELAGEFPVRLHSRGGIVRDLSLSVLEGIRLARSNHVVVMDADLSHPPGAIPAMVSILESGDADVVIGSRYVAGGSFDREWDFWRYLNSRVATLLAAPLVKCSDPMSGFFALNRHVLANLQELNPIGYKILLELLVRAAPLRVREYPIRFRDRDKGQSKMDLRQQWNYLRHLRRLYLFRYRQPSELVHFLAVGASGFIIDVAGYYLFQSIGIEHRLARGLSFWPAVTSNWFLNRNTTFSERKRRPRLRQWSEFVVTCLIGFTVNWGTYVSLTTHVDFFDSYRPLAFLTGIALGTLFNFSIASLYVYSEKRADVEETAPVQHPG